MIVGFSRNTIPPDGYLTLAILGTDVLLLRDYLDNPYNRQPEGWDKSNGRSLAGSLRVQGNNYATKMTWNLSFLAKPAMLTVLNQMLESQRSGNTAEITDAWHPNEPVISKPVFLDAPQDYRKWIGRDWHQIRLIASEV